MNGARDVPAVDRAAIKRFFDGLSVYVIRSRFRACGNHGKQLMEVSE